MQPLNVALIYRSRSPQDGAEMRLKQGMWSYPVPEFTWTGYGMAKGFTLDRAQLKGHDVIFHEDWVRGVIDPPHRPPRLAFWAVDSNTSLRRRAKALRYARCADLVLVDQDTTYDWPCTARRLAYAVNEQVFKPLEKKVDVGFYVEPTPERGELGEWLAAFCREHGYTYDATHGLPVADYAARMGEARIVVHLSTHPQCRSHRLFDALACGCCLLTSPLPVVGGDGFIPGEHLMEWHSRDELGSLITSLLKGGAWQAVADAGRQFVLENHTWQKRAKKLRQLLNRLL